MGFYNTVQYGCASSILGGQFNTITGFQCQPYFSAIVAGWNNSINNYSWNSFIGSGYYNCISEAPYAFIGGGFCNSIYHGIPNTGSSQYGVIVGGYQNFLLCSPSASVSAGFNNTITNSTSASITNGTGNKILSTPYGSILGGVNNIIESLSHGSSILGGCNNKICRQNNFTPTTNSSTIAGGECNTIFSPRSFIGGGFCNTISQTIPLQPTSSQAILGGTRNTMNGGNQSVIIGGSNNVNYGDNNFILGTNINSNRSCTTFVNNLSIMNIPTSSTNLPSGAIWRCTTDNTLRIIP
jgi:hypothetical protein